MVSAFHFGCFTEVGSVHERWSRNIPPPSRCAPPAQLTCSCSHPLVAPACSHCPKPSRLLFDHRTLLGRCAPAARRPSAPKVHSVVSHGQSACLRETRSNPLSRASTGPVEQARTLAPNCCIANCAAAGRVLSARGAPNSELVPLCSACVSNGLMALCHEVQVDVFKAEVKVSQTRLSSTTPPTQQSSSSATTRKTGPSGSRRRRRSAFPRGIALSRKKRAPMP